MNGESRPQGPAPETTATTSETNVRRTADEPRADAQADPRLPLYDDPKREADFREWQRGLARRAEAARRLPPWHDGATVDGDGLRDRDPWLWGEAS